MFMYIVVSCLFALGVNISNYLVLGKTSPLTYQVLGHLKTVLILILGFTVFNVMLHITVMYLLLRVTFDGYVIICCLRFVAIYRNLSICAM